MAVAAVAIAVAGLLIHYRRHLRHSLVGCDLDRLVHSLVGQLLLCEHQWKRIPFGWRRGMECRHLSGLAGLSGPFGLGNGGCTQERNESKKCLHSDDILPQIGAAWRYL